MMRYAFLVHPHANARYSASLTSLAKAELAILLRAIGQSVNIDCETLGGAPWLCFECETLSPDAWRLLSLHASSYLLASTKNRSVTPIERSLPAYIGADLAEILKYKGKTNVLFTDFLLNIALATSDFLFRLGDPLCAVDPLCGRGTTLFLALRKGWHAVGVDSNKTDIKAVSDYFTRYLEHHRIKHKRSENTQTVRGKAGGRLTKFVFADTFEHYKAGDTRSLSVICGDARDLDLLCGTGSQHVLVADLPYGIQHKNTQVKGGRVHSIEALMRESLPAWLHTLKPGGAAAISFNTYITPRKCMITWMREAGFDVCEGEYFDHLEHWVEQAVNRDVAVGVKR